MALISHVTSTEVAPFSFEESAICYDVGGVRKKMAQIKELFNSGKMNPQESNITIKINHMTHIGLEAIFVILSVILIHLDTTDMGVQRTGRKGWAKIQGDMQSQHFSPFLDMKENKVSKSWDIVVLSFLFFYSHFSLWGFFNGSIFVNVGHEKILNEKPSS
ncbi:hypothetical protein ACJX0J_008962, partial [Zea mays]